MPKLLSFYPRTRFMISLAKALLPRRANATFGLAAVGVMAFAMAGCSPKIGDACRVPTECSSRGDRACDLTQSGGYCTQFNCAKNSCPDDAACVLFNAASPGCPYDDRSGASGSRFARSLCLAACESQSDCRAGYVCADPTTPPWRGLILDSAQGKRTCLMTSGYDDNDGGVAASIPPPPVCMPGVADVPPIDASAPNLVVEIESDAGASSDAGSIQDGGASSDAGDAGGPADSDAGSPADGGNVDDAGSADGGASDAG